MYLRDLKKRDGNKNWQGDLTPIKPAARRAGILLVKSEDRDVEAQAPARGKGHVPHRLLSSPLHSPDSMGRDGADVFPRPLLKQALTQLKPDAKYTHAQTQHFLLQEDISS